MTEHKGGKRGMSDSITQTLKKRKKKKKIYALEGRVLAPKGKRTYHAAQE